MDAEPADQHTGEHTSQASKDTLQHDDLSTRTQYEVIHTSTVVDSVQGPPEPVNEVELSPESSKGVNVTLNTSHNSYTIAYKLAVLDWYHANGENKSLTSKHFGVARKRIRDWTLMENYLRSMPPTCRMRRRNFPQEGKSFGKRPPGSQELDLAILHWYKEQKESGKVVYSRQLKAKALELGPQFGLPETFKASAMWLQNWKKRFAADIQKASVVEESHDDVGSVAISPDFEEQLRQLEQVGTHLTCEQDNLQVEHTNDTSAFKLTLNSTTETDAASSPDQSKGSLHQLHGKDSLETKIKEQDQWISVVEQTLESLETEVNKKLGQAKLILQQLKTGQAFLKQQLQNSLSLSQSVLTTSRRTVKRPSTPEATTRQTKRSRNT